MTIHFAGKQKALELHLWNCGAFADFARNAIVTGKQIGTVAVSRRSLLDD
jgi:hypothetical protein